MNLQKSSKFLMCYRFPELDLKIAEEHLFPFHICFLCLAVIIHTTSHESHCPMCFADSHFSKSLQS